MQKLFLAGAVSALFLGVCSAGFLENDADVVVADVFSTLLTDAATEADELRDCLTVPTYPVGKCTITGSPGACYTLQGDADLSWICWADITAADQRNDAYCQQPLGKRGACRFADHGKNVTDDDLPSCFKVPGGFKTQCHPVTDYWGACYKGDSQTWMCIDKGDANIAKYRLDCKVIATPDGVTAYDGACTFGEIKQKIYKCPTVPTYDKDEGRTSCLGPPQAPFACFSLTRGVDWSCLQNGTNPSCTTTYDGKGNTYDGACVNDNSPDWDTAEDGHGLTTTTSSTTTTTTTETTTTTSLGAAAGLSAGLASSFAFIAVLAAQAF